MMKNAFNLKLAVLGFVSSTCLIGAASADVGVNGAQIAFTQVPELFPTACGTEPYQIRLKLENISDDIATVYDIDTIIVNPDDTTNGDTQAVTYVQPSTPTECGSRGVPFTLKGTPESKSGSMVGTTSCYITLEINPEAPVIQDQCDQNIFDPDMIVDRSLVVSAYTDTGGATADITFDISTIGSSELLSTLSSNLCGDDTESACSSIESQQDGKLAGTITAGQDVAVYGSNTFLDIGFVTNLLDLGATGIHKHYKPSVISKRALADATAAYNDLLNLALNNCSDTTSPNVISQDAHITSVLSVPSDPSSPRISSPVTFTGSDEETTFICVDDTQIATVDNTITLEGDGIYLFVVNPNLGTDPESYISLSFMAESDMELTCDTVDTTDCAESGDVFWVVNGQMEVDNDSLGNPDAVPGIGTLIGTFLTSLDIEVDSQNTSMPAEFVGRLLTIDGDILLDGNQIIAPKDEDDTTVPDTNKVASL
jgi:hypothetical protein